MCAPKIDEESCRYPLHPPNRRLAGQRARGVDSLEEEIANFGLRMANDRQIEHSLGLSPARQTRVKYHDMMCYMSRGERIKIPDCRFTRRQSAPFVAINCGLTSGGRRLIPRGDIEDRRLAHRYRETKAKLPSSVAELFTSISSIYVEKSDFK